MYRYSAATWITVILSFLLCLLVDWPVRGQIINIPETEIPLSLRGINQIGELETGEIRLDGQLLFRVAAPASDSPSSGNKLSPIERRVRAIQFRLNDLVSDGLDPNTLQVSPAILNNETVVAASDEDSDLQPIMTITAFDLAIEPRRFNINSLAKQRAELIHSALIQAWTQRQPEYIRQQIGRSLLILLAMVGSSLLIGRLQKLRHFLSLNINTKKQQRESSQSQVPLDHNSIVSIESVETRQPVRAYHQSFLTKLWPSLNLDQQAKLNLITFPILAAAQISTWLVGSAVILQNFAQTRALGVWLVRVPTSLILIPVGLAIIHPFAELILRWRLSRFLEWRKERKGSNSRLKQRFETIWIIIQEVLRYIFILIGILLFGYFTQVLPIVLIMIAAIAYLSQDLIKDAQQAFFILFEDQYALGDWIRIGDIYGQVEKISLRATQLRGVNQDLFTIANGSFTKVTNSTSQRSGLHLNINVTHDTNLDKAITVMEKVIMDLYDSEKWGKYITEKPHVLGVDSIGESSLTISLVLITQPGQQWAVGREFRHQLKVAFDQAGIEVASPKRSVWLMSSSEHHKENLPQQPGDLNDDNPLGH